MKSTAHWHLYLQLPPATIPTIPTCEKDEFQCANHRCISSTLRCNFFNDCEDFGSDEIGCKTGIFEEEMIVNQDSLKDFLSTYQSAVASLCFQTRS